MKTKNLLYLISFLEGSALMAAEIIGSKTIAPWYGNSLYVWTSVFVCTLTGLALGYFYGAKLSAKNENILKKLLLILTFSSIYFSIMHPLSSFIMDATISLSIQLGSLISVLVFLFPLFFAFGCVSPLIIKLITVEINETGKKSARIYTISTFGGILSTLFFGFYSVPVLGLKMSIIISTCIIALATLFGYILHKNKITE